MCAVQGQPSETVNMRLSNAKGTPAPPKERRLPDGCKHFRTVVF